MAKYPPLVPRTRLVFTVLRMLGTLVLVGSVWLGWSYINDGDTLTGVRVLVGGTSFAVASWMSPYSPWFPAFLAIPILVFPIVGGSGLLFFAIALISVLWLVWRRTQPIKVDPEGVRRAADDAVMPHALKFVAELEALGWDRVGAVAADIGRMEITIAVLLSPDRRSYSEITDVVITLTSVFTDGRTLVTRNSAMSPMSEWVLTNDLRGASPTTLAISHDRALEILESNRVTPLLLDGTGLLDFVVEQEKISVEAGAGFKRGLNSSGKGSGPIDRSAESSERIRQWQWKTGPDVTHLLNRPETNHT